MKFNATSTGHFPYGSQPNYREFLIPAELQKQFSEHHQSNRESANPLVIARYFNPAWSQTWFMTEYDAEAEIFFGFVTGMPFPEWGCVALRDFIDLQLPLWLKIERDLHFSPTRFDKAVPESERQPS